MQVTEESLLAHENLTHMSVDSSLQISSEDGSTQVFPPGVMIICCYVSLIFLHTDNRTVIVAGSMSQMKFGMKLMQTKI